MRSTRLRSLGAVLALSVTLAGCGKGATAPQVNQQQANEVAEQVAALLFLGPNVTTPPTSASGPAGDAEASGMNMHRRAAGPLRVRAESDLAWTFDVRWYDASGGEQFWYDSSSTARVVTDQTARGSYAGEGFTATMGHSGHVDLSGLLASQPEILVSATRRDTLDASYVGTNAQAQLSLKCTGSFDQVRRSKPLEENPYPSSGRAGWAVNAHRAVQSNEGSRAENFTTSVLVTYNGTRYVPLVVNNQWHYTLDLETGALTPVAV